MLTFNIDWGFGSARFFHVLLEKCIELDKKARDLGLAKRVTLLFMWCIPHVTTHMVTLVFDFKRVIPRTYSLCFALRFPPRFRKLVKVIFELIEKDLRDGGSDLQSRILEILSALGPHCVLH